MLTNNLDRLVVYVDGGCKANGQANPHAYGSYAVHAYGKDGSFEVGKIEHADYPQHSTNNQAEYQALIDGARYTKDLLQRAKLGRLIEIRFKTDSELVVNQCNDRAKTKNAKLIELRDQARAALEAITAYLEKEDREIIVHALGH